MDIFGEAMQRWLKHGGAGLDIWGSNAESSAEVVENKGEQSWIFGEAVQRWLKHRGEQGSIFGEAVPRWLKTKGSRVGYSGKQCRGG